MASSRSDSEHVGGESRRALATARPDLTQERLPGWIRHLIKLLLQSPRAGRGINVGRGNVLVAQEFLYVGDVHALIQKPRGDRMQYALLDGGLLRHGAHN